MQPTPRWVARQGEEGEPATGSRRLYHPAAEQRRGYEVLRAMKE